MTEERKEPPIKEGSISYIRDLNGIDYPLQATITNNIELNGNQTITFTVLPSKVNLPFIHDISEMWEVIDGNNVIHKIIYAKKRGEGSLLTVEIKAIPLFFDTFDNSRIYEEYNQHMTAMEAFTKIFSDMSFGFTLVDTFDAVEWEGFGAGESRLETFKRALNRYKAEFRIVGNTVYLERQIGRDASFMYRYKLNASNIVKEIDAGEYWTYAKGYGNYGDGEGGGDWQDAELIREYTSPLAKILGIREAPPIKDGRVKVKSAMDEALKTLVDDSLKISITTDIHDLRRQDYALAQPEVGDRVFIIDERIGLDEEVRVIDISVTKDWRGNVLDLNLTIGSESLTKRHQSNMSTAVDRINELIEGRRKLPFSVLDDAVKNATEALKGITSELSVPPNGGLMAVDKDDPNNVVLFNAAGVGVSNDGGNSFRTAMTGNGIVADVITAGTLNADQVAIVGGGGNDYMYISGAYQEARGTFQQTWLGQTSTYDIKTMLQHGYLRFRNDTEKSSLYFSWNGVSTYADGEGADEEEGSVAGSSGTIAWWDRTYSDGNTYKGISVKSQAGTPAMVSGTNKIILHPMADRSNKAFHFTKSGDYQDGYLMWTRFDSSGTAPRGGFRFVNSESGKLEIVDSNYSTGGNTSLDVGNVYTNNVTNRSGTASVYWNNTSRGTTTGSNSTLRATGIRTASGDSVMYLATDGGGHVSVTDYKGHNGGDGVTFRPIYASEFKQQSTENAKLNIEPYDEKGVEIVRDTQIYTYYLKSDVEAGEMNNMQIGFVAEYSPKITHDNSISLYTPISVNWKATQEIIEELKDIKGRLNRLEGEIK